MGTPQHRPTFFTRFSRGISRVAGRPYTFALVCLLVLAWAVSGPLFGFGTAWQLTINTITTIVTFLMVFLIQATQNRDSEAIQIKLDEIIRSTDGAHNELLGLEELEEGELLKVHRKYLDLAERAGKALGSGHGDTEVGRLRAEHRKVVEHVKHRRRRKGNGTGARAAATPRRPRAG